ncbi:uncharacterized protein EI90DRAFT_2058423 [Cantharellus anzutake]|uniref:uncharacterized protein n=1 Tax=Cantharellus anzutake TaxID=1750568 RepID=UPI0019055941|nr:uncharacterized protein EI90DRAFT_2058423 [Cantharellus anzutake]KAF8340392.1 hypothetical protein EI90DRAFT_2058423 [Cantharellus anzutake]
MMSRGSPRTKDGCFTCRVRRKACKQYAGHDTLSCEECFNLRLQCMKSYGQSRPSWLAEKDYRKEIVVKAIAEWTRDPRNKSGDQFLNLERFEFAPPPPTEPVASKAIPNLEQFQHPHAAYSRNKHMHFEPHLPAIGRGQSSDPYPGYGTPLVNGGAAGPFTVLTGTGNYQHIASLVHPTTVDCTEEVARLQDGQPQPTRGPNGPLLLDNGSWGELPDFYPAHLQGPNYRQEAYGQQYYLPRTQPEYFYIQ